MKNGLFQLKNLGQSIWYDNISRNLLRNGGLKSLAEDGVFGVTSNPTIFEKAISSGDEYNTSIINLLKKSLTPTEIIEELMIEDIKEACDIFLPIYETTAHKDGFISIEVDPTLANDTQNTIEGAKRLWGKIQRPNLMIKIPATLEGLPAITEVIALGINVNVTLIFSIKRYEEVTKAYLKGLLKAKENGLNLENINSVASVFVSRLDTLVDKILSEKISQGNNYLNDFLGKSAIANVKILYQSFKSIFYSDDFWELKKYGANIQRPLWASTGTKNPNYSQTLYVDEIVAPETVNTLPPSTLEIVKSKEYTKVRIEEDLEYYTNVIKSLENNGIEFDKVFEQLEIEGVNAFIKSFKSLQETIKNKIREIN